ncbi:hypothetical protein D3C84_1200360 [compost metagenome]
MHLAQLCRERRWRYHIAGFPAGDVIGLAEGADHEGALIQLFMGQHADVGHTVVDQVFVDLIADHIDVTIAD